MFVISSDVNFTFKLIGGCKFYPWQSRLMPPFRYKNILNSNVYKSMSVNRKWKLALSNTSSDLDMVNSIFPLGQIFRWFDSLGFMNKKRYRFGISSLADVIPSGDYCFSQIQVDNSIPPYEPRIVKALFTFKIKWAQYNCLISA